MDETPSYTGHLLPPERPGLGVEFDEAAAAEGKSWPRPGVGLWRDDGSYTNW